MIRRLVALLVLIYEYDGNEVGDTHTKQGDDSECKGREQKTVSR